MKSAKRSVRAFGCCLVAAGLACLAVGGSPLPSSARSGESEQHFEPRDFAQARGIQTKLPGTLQTLLIPMPVYASSVEPRLADLRVFDAEGEAVPHTVRSLASPAPRADLSEPLPLFSLPDGVPRVGSGVVKQGAQGFWKREDGLRIDARIDEKEASIRLESGAAAGQAAEQTTGYLVDTGEGERVLVGLELELTPGDEPFVAALRLRGSDDLVSFDELTARATVARLEQGGHRIELRRVDFKPSRHRYLEITWPDGDMPAEVSAVRGRLAPRAPAPQRFDVKVKGSVVESEPRTFLYDLGGTPPVDRVQVELSRADDVIEAQLYSAVSPEGPWHRLHRGLFFDIEHAGRRHRNEAVATRASRHRYYRLEVSPKGGGGRGRAPRLDVSWRPEQLIFVARGEAPFTLSSGRAGVEASEFDFSDLLAITRHPDRELPLQSAKLGRVRAVADPSVLEAPRWTLEPRTLALWGALILAVALIAGMSLRVLREMKD